MADYTATLKVYHCVAYFSLDYLLLIFLKDYIYLLVFFMNAPSLYFFMCYMYFTGVSTVIS